MRHLALAGLVAACAGTGTPGPLARPPTVEAEGIHGRTGTGTDVGASGVEAQLLDQGRVVFQQPTVSTRGVEIDARTAVGVVGQSLVTFGAVHGRLRAPESPARDGADAGPGARGMEFEAQRMRLDPRAHTAILEGGVTVRRGDVTLEAGRITVTYNPAGQPVHARAEGPVSVHTPGGTLTARGGAVLDLTRQRLEVPGRVNVVRGTLQLEGDGVVVDLATGALEMTAVQGSLGEGLN